jgi:hypothetical protein
LTGEKTTHSPALSRARTPWAQCLDAHRRTHWARTAQHDIDSTRLDGNYRGRIAPRRKRTLASAHDPGGGNRRHGLGCAVARPLHAPQRCTHPSKWSSALPRPSLPSPNAAGPRGYNVYLPSRCARTPSFLRSFPPTVFPRGSAAQAPHTEPQCLDRRSLDHRCALWSRGQALRGYSPAVWAARCQESRSGLFVLAW